ncbi:MAG: WGR domain-containing protein [Planctomycetota bacterium]|nr:WGR domain-containing protein [Planctomycetota bacterium]
MSSATPSQSTTLYFRCGGSDKIYAAHVQPLGAGFVVNFAFGRRGTTLQTGTKTAKPVDYPTAMKLYDRLVREKTAKGYTAGQAGTPYQGTERQALATGVLPQLLNPIDQDDADRLIGDDDWWMQEKFDGRRILIRRDGNDVTGINRKGLVVALPQPVTQQALTIGDNQWLMDGEAVGDVYVAFDLLEADGEDLRQAGYDLRLTYLSRMLESIGKAAIRLVQTACTATAKRQLLAQLRRDNREGAVFKRALAPYTPGRPASGGDQLKLKFTATASCIVAGGNGTRRSVALALLDDGNRVGVGNVTIPPRQPIPVTGSVIEVRYLYAHVGGCLFQPVYLGVRDDIGPEACTIGQLKYKAAADDEEDAESGVRGQCP